MLPLLQLVLETAVTCSGKICVPYLCRWSVVRARASPWTVFDCLSSFVYVVVFVSFVYEVANLTHSAALVVVWPARRGVTLVLV